MKARTQVDIDPLVMTMEITMTVKEWREVMRALPHVPWSASELGGLIAETIGSVTNAANQTIETTS